MLASFAHEVLRPLAIEMLGGVICATFFFAAAFISAHFLGATAWNLLPGVVGMVIGVRVSKRILPPAS